jgi:prepilin-type processing-associated H-X9-DG protein
VAPDVVKRSQEQLAGTARKLGDLIGDSLKSRTSHATELVVTTKCGHYLFANISFADGSAKSLNLGNAPASQSDMDKAKAAMPILRFVDQPGCDP